MPLYISATSKRSKTIQELTDQKHSDQRYFPRWLTKTRVVCHFDKENQVFEGHTRDLNCTGTCVSLQKIPRMSQKVNLTIYLSDDKYVNVNGLVMWEHQVADHTNVGIQFHEINEHTRDIIFEHAFELNRKEIVNHWFTGWDKKI